MKDKNVWITQEIKISCKYKRSLYAFTKNSNDPKAKAHYIKYCTVLRKVRKEAKKQHYSRLGGKSHDKIKATRNTIKKERVKVHSVEQVPILLVNDGKLKDPTNLTNAFNNVFITITEKIKHLTNTERRHCLTAERFIL